VKDIWDQNSKIFVNSTEIFNRLRDERNWIAEYSRIKASFSHELLLMLKSDNINQENTKSYPYFTILIPDIFHRFKPTFGEIGQK
jgi:hypothetical protein